MRSVIRQRLEPPFSKAKVEVIIFCMTVSISNNVVKEFGPPCLYDSFSSLRFVDNHLCTAVLMFCHSRLKSGLWLGYFDTPTLFFFTHSVVCCCALAHWCMIQIRPSFRCQTDGLIAVYKKIHMEEFIVISMTGRCTGPVYGPLWLRFHIRCLWWYAVFGFQQPWHCALWPNTSKSGSSVQSPLFQKSWLFHIKLRKS